VSKANAEIPKRCAVLALGGLSLTAGLVFALGRVASFGPNRGDVSVWISVHEWIKRDVPLYVGVWDHKDWGFFWFTQPFYEIWATTGLYIVGFLSAVLVGIGAYLIVRKLTPPLSALLLGVLAMTISIAAFSFLPTYTEIFAVGLASLAIGILVHERFLGGFIFATSIAVKVSGVVVLVTVLTFELVAEWRRLRGGSLKSMIRPAALTVAGVGVGLLFIVGLASASGSLYGWLEIITYNREYAQFRGSLPAGSWVEKPIILLQTYLQDFVNLPKNQFSFLSALALSSGVLLLLWRPRKPGPNDLSTSDQQRLIVVIASGYAFGALAVTLSQRPGWFHWQYAVAPLCLLMVATWAAAQRSGAFSSLTKLTVGIILLTPPLVVALYFNRSLVSAVTPDALNQWKTLNSGAVLTAELAGLQPNTSLAIFATNSVRADYAAMPPNVELKCRFIYQFDHLLPRYRDEILSCQGKDPDVVIVQNSEWADDVTRSSILSWLADRYTPCNGVRTIDYQLWGKEESVCPTMTKF